MAHFLVTGGSGFLGINLIRRLLRLGHEVRSLDKEEFFYPEKDRVDAIVGDIRDRKTVLEAMKRIDRVVHCAAALPLYSKKDIFSTDVDGTGNILESAERRAVDRVIHISSTAVYGIPDHHPIKEDDYLDGVGSYGQAKIDAEVVCVQYRARGMCVPIIRPKSFIGPERLGVFALLYDWAKDGHGFPVLGNGKNRYQLLDVDDLVDAIMLCADKDRETVNHTFNIGAKEFTTIKEDFQAVLDRAGFGKKISTFPAWPMIWTLRLLELFRISPLYKWVYETSAKDSFVSIEKAERKLGFQPKYSNKQALIRNYEWYLEHVKEFEGKTGISHRVPWKQGILRFVKKYF